MSEHKPKLTEEIFNSPDCPEWARYVTVDKNGLAYAYTAKPVLVEKANGWTSDKKCKCIGVYDNSDWKNSLISKPDITEDPIPQLTEEIFNSPDCPKWAKWAAVDADGSGHVFDDKPDKELLYWSRSRVKGVHIGMYDPSAWENSLIERQL